MSFMGPRITIRRFLDPRFGFAGSPMREIITDQTG